MKYVRLTQNSNNSNLDYLLNILILKLILIINKNKINNNILNIKYF